MGNIEMKKVKPEEYDFTKERIELAVLIGYEYGMLSQATGEYDDSMAFVKKIREAAFNYGFVIINPGEDWNSWDWWYIDTGKARNFAEQKAKEIHDDIFKKRRREYAF